MGLIPHCDDCGGRLDGDRPRADTPGMVCSQCAGEVPDDRERYEVGGDIGRPGSPGGSVKVMDGERTGRYANGGY